MVKRSKNKQPPSGWIPGWLPALVLFLAVVAVYSPVWRAGYIFDDDQVFTANPVVVGPLGVATNLDYNAADICPLTLTTFWFEHKLWGLAPLPYHLVTVLFHAACAIVLWQVLRRLRIPGAWLGSALWALHPVMVESVAWISEMKNTESTLFFLLAILFFPRNYILTLLFAALAMAGKSSTVILPIALCLCAWWMEQKWNWRTLAKIAPVFLMAAADSLFTIWRQGLFLATPADQWLARSWPERFVTAGDAVWFYLGKLLWPHPLITVYPRWQIDSGQWYAFLPLLAVVIVFVVLWLNRHSWSRPWLFAFAYFIAALLPVLGFATNTYDRLSFVADHFQYLAAMGPLALVGAGIARLSDFFSQKALISSAISAGLLLILGTCSWQRAWIYENEDTLWLDTLAQNPACWIGHNNYGNSLVHSGRLDEGLAHLQRALELNPNFPDAEVNVGTALMQKGQITDAIAHFQRALELNPNFAEAEYNLGVAYSQQGRVPQAILHFQKAVEINPNYANAQYDLGVALGQQGRPDAAIAQFRKALALNPNFAEAHNNLGIYLARSGHLDEAIIQFKEALRVKPNYADAQNNLARVQAALQQNAGQK